MSQNTSPRIEFVIEKLRAITHKGWQQVAEKTGIPESTIRKIAYRETKNPRAQTLDPLHLYFSAAKKAKKPH